MLRKFGSIINQFLPWSSSTKKILQNTVLVTLSLLLALIFLEYFVRNLFFSHEQVQAGAKLLWKRYHNDYVQPFDGDSNCTFADTIIPHPFLVFVHSNEQVCPNHSVNNRGTRSAWNIPDQRDPNFFSILLVGGSVATQLANGNRANSQRNWLEDYLNERFQSPNKKPFRIIGGAAGGWSFPNQLNILNLFGNGVDAIVAVDGYNESLPTAHGMPIYTPDQSAYFLSLQGNQLSWASFSFHVLFQLRKAAYQSRIFENSFLSYLVFERFMNLVSKSESIQNTRRDTVGWYLEFEPKPKDKEESDRWNYQAYIRYVKLIRAQSEVFGIKYAHFLQPVPMIGKTLTEEEKSHFQVGNAEHYKRNYINAVAELARDGLPSFDLTQIFKDRPETIYSDHIHCKFEKNWESPGYKLMSEAILNHLASAWKLSAKSKATSTDWPQLN